MGSGRPTVAYKLDESKILKFVAENPDAVLEEIASNFNVTAPGILKSLKRLNITRKKVHTLQRKM